MITENTGKDFDSVIANAPLEKIYAERRERVYAYLRSNNITAAVFEDTEGSRDCALRYLTGHPSDAVLVLTQDGNSILYPWDENLASERAHADNILSYTECRRINTEAVKDALKSVSSSSGKPVLALSTQTSYPLYNKYASELPEWIIQCKEDSVHDFVISMRAVKDEYEIACTRKACAITSAMTDIIVPKVAAGEIKTEMDVALFVERELREKGCERTSFDTLAAGPSRSFAIHAFPGYTNGLWGNQGLSILDYGVCYEGYASDCTITIAKGPLTDVQNQQLNYVQKAFDECLELYKPGNRMKLPAERAAEIFAEIAREMPHGLGHGTGLEIHEAPYASLRAKDDKVFESGNIVTLEPGLYDPVIGGCRLENDVLITDSGNCVLTNSKIFRL